MDLGEIIRLRRTQLGMSQADLARAANVDARQIRRYESGEQQPLFTVAAAIATRLGIPLTELAGMASTPCDRP
jgi:transcriptional regulator with XRE-family HTH domain